MIKPITYCLLLSGLLAACNSKPEAQQATADSTFTTEEKEVKKDNSLPPGEQQVIDDLYAQDTLFEDGSRPSSWANAGFNNPVAFKKFVLRLKEWVKNDSIGQIAAHIRFPLRKTANAQEFARQYHSLFNTTAKEAIANQRPDRIFRNQDGAMLANGLIWIVPSGKDYTITAINN